MIVWQGVGAYGFVIPFGVVFGAFLAALALLGQETTSQFGRVIFGLALLVSAGLVYLLAQNLAKRPSRVFIDKETGQEVTFSERHTMFWVPLRYWAVLYAVVGVALIVIGLVIGSK